MNRNRTHEHLQRHGKEWCIPRFGVEKSLTDNSYYKSLNDSEKSKLRAYCNEYEQAISAGKELSGWKAKAYMAKEAGIQPGTYALFQTALSLINSDGGNS